MQVEDTAGSCVPWQGGAWHTGGAGGGQQGQSPMPEVPKQCVSIIVPECANDWLKEEQIQSREGNSKSSHRPPPFMLSLMPMFLISLLQWNCTAPFKLISV